MALLLVYPASLARLNARLKCPKNTRDDSSLTVALLPWKTSPTIYKPQNFQKPFDVRYGAMEPVVEKWKTHGIGSVYSAAARMSLKLLSFDDWVLPFMPGRNYCIWSYPVDPLPSDGGKKIDRLRVRPETKALLRILDETGAKNVGYNADLRVIFVHVGALRTINNLPSVTKWRSERFDVHFIAYGFHESVPKSRWGTHEVFPLGEFSLSLQFNRQVIITPTAGGIVTFTYRALLDDPYYAAQLIEKLHSHTLWTVYLLPSVLAVFIRRACVGDDPLTEYSR